MVAEFDVYLSGKLKDDLHLFQYPLRPNYRSYGDQGSLYKVEMATQQIEIKSALNDEKIKQTSVEFDSLKMHYKLNTVSSNYDVNAVDHRVIIISVIFSLQIHTHYLESQKVDNTSQVQPNYCVCVLTSDGKLMMTPLTSFHQVRPSFDHVDKEKLSRTVTNQHVTPHSIERKGQQPMKPRDWRDVKFHN